MNRCRPRIWAARTALLALLLLVAGALPARAAEPLLVFAAASTREAVLAVTALARERLGTAVEASFAGSAALARQIEAGAPADLFLSANTDWMDRLAESGAILPSSRRALVRNRLVIIAPSDRPASVLPDPLTGDADLVAALGGGRFGIADPDSVPAGIYGRQSLEMLGLWSTIGSRLAPAADVRAALALVARGEVRLGLVYSTDARAADGVTTVSTIPADTHEPIVYPIALTASGADKPTARALLDLFLSAEGRAAFANRGFQPIGD